MKFIRLSVFCLICAIRFGPAEAQQVNPDATLEKEAKITMEQAQKTALAKEPGTIKSKELEKEKGKLIYSFDIKTKSGTHEVNVDALTGEVVGDSVESKADEEKEKQNDAKQSKQAQMPSQSTAAVLDASKAGATIYKAKCAMCHGPDGKGDTAMGKNLKLKDLASDDVQNVHDSEMKTLIESGKGKMPSFKGKLTDKQLGDVIQYIRTMKKK